MNLSAKPNPMELASIGEAEESGNDKLNLSCQFVRILLY